MSKSTVLLLTLVVCTVAVTRLEPVKVAGRWNVALENKIAFSVTINAEGQPTVGNFAGDVEGDKMSGVVEFEGAGEGTWSAARVQEK